MNYFDNLRVIAQGGGSDQVRACKGKKCPQCEDDWGEEEERGEEEEIERREMKIDITPTFTVDCSSKNPTTYIDADGILRLVTTPNTPRPDYVVKFEKGRKQHKTRRKNV